MTEEEAKNTRCCGPEGCGQPGIMPASRWCIGSACMAWRWVGVRRKTDIGPTARTIDHLDERSAEEARAKTYHNRNVGFLGACGLAGRP